MMKTTSFCIKTGDGSSLFVQKSSENKSGKSIQRRDNLSDEMTTRLCSKKYPNFQDDSSIFIGIGKKVDIFATDSGTV